MERTSERTFTQQTHAAHMHTHARMYTYTLPLAQSIAHRTCRRESRGRAAARRRPRRFALVVHQARAWPLGNAPNACLSPEPTRDVIAYGRDALRSSSSVLHRLPCTRRRAVAAHDTRWTRLHRPGRARLVERRPLHQGGQAHHRLHGHWPARASFTTHRPTVSVQPHQRCLEGVGRVTVAAAASVRQASSRCTNASVASPSRTASGASALSSRRRTRHTATTSRG